MNNILQTIVENKRKELEAARALVAESDLEKKLDQAPPKRPFAASLKSADGLAIIAEVKKASPSAGVIRADFNPVEIAKIYERHGASAISVLTELRFFQGSLAFLEAIRQAVARPLLRKDFVVDRYQLLEARLAGADAVLLIAEILEQEQLVRLVRGTRELDMETLVELYEPENLSRVIDSGTEMIGINNRNLRTFETRLQHTLEVAPRVPESCCLISESGIHCREDLELLREAGVRAVLVGETLMRAADIGAKLDELRGIQASSSQPTRP